MAKKLHVATTINGEPIEFLCDARQSLLEVLRDTLNFSGAKEGCNNGNCGACTVLVDGLPVDSCLVLAVEAEGASITTIEGLSPRVAFASDSAVLPGRRGAAMRRLHAGLHHDRPRPCWIAARIRASRRFVFNWPATCAAARGTTRSCARCRIRPRRWRRGDKVRNNRDRKPTGRRRKQQRRAQRLVKRRSVTW